MRQFETLTDALKNLSERGFTYNFNLAENCLECKEVNRIFYPDEFHIAEYYRFEGMTDPADSAVLYAIESHDGLKGVLVNAYGVYADVISANMVAKLRMPAV
jgi:hypothetical protein